MEYGDIELNDDDYEMTWEQRQQYKRSFEQYSEGNIISHDDPLNSDFDWKDIDADEARAFADIITLTKKPRRRSTHSVVDNISPASQESLNARPIVETEAYLVHHRAVVRHLIEKAITIVYVNHKPVTFNDIHRYTRHMPKTGCTNGMNVSTSVVYA